MKKDGILRLCVDCKATNKSTVRNRSPQSDRALWTLSSSCLGIRQLRELSLRTTRISRSFETKGTPGTSEQEMFCTSKRLQRILSGAQRTRHWLNRFDAQMTGKYSHFVCLGVLAFLDFEKAYDRLDHG